MTSLISCPPIPAKLPALLSRALVDEQAASLNRAIDSRLAHCFALLWGFGATFGVFRYSSGTKSGVVGLLLLGDPDFLYKGDEIRVYLA